MARALKPVRHDLDRPVVTVVMDGVGVRGQIDGNAVLAAHTPTLDHLRDNALYTELRAHGTAVGLESDKDMGNSEVGHNAMGAGKIYDQGAKRVALAFESGEVFQSSTWQHMVSHVIAQKSTLHFIGLLSDGNVHSHISQLLAMLERAARVEDIKRARIHVLLDGRDVPERSALRYAEKLEALLAVLRKDGFDYRVASGGGRMTTTMDRYEADWSIVERGYLAHVHGIGRPMISLSTAINTFYAEDAQRTDQYLPEFVITEDEKPVGKILDADAVILFNFRGDRAIEITRAFEEANFAAFDRENNPDVFFAGMMQYDGDLMLPKTYLVEPPEIDNTVGEYLTLSHKRIFACSETQKYGHMTYFWNGNRSGYFDQALETYLEIQSDKIPFDQKPEMKANEIAEALVEAIKSRQFDSLRVNFANGDMVGHTGNYRATVLAIEAVDAALEKVVAAVNDVGAALIVTADHGNADEMYLDTQSVKTNKRERTPKTSHTLNAVPCYIYDADDNRRWQLAEVPAPGLANIAATMLTLHGLEVPEKYETALIK